MSLLSEQDDLLHPPANDDRWWSETNWFSFDQPGSNISATIYPVFRPNLGICSLGVFIWDASAHEPWKARYARSYWHLAMPTMPLTELALEGLRYERLEPLQRYRVSYADRELASFDLEFTGLRPAHEAGIRNGVGHYDQPCSVVGELVLRGETIAIDTVGMRDRTWSVRPEDRRKTGTAYTYGTASADEQFLLMTTLQGDAGTFLSDVFTGYLVRDGVKTALVDAKRRVIERTDGYPVRVEIEAVDEQGRRLEATGRCVNRLANQATPGQFAWMSMTEWTVVGAPAGGPPMIGEDQEVWSPDRISTH